MEIQITLTLSPASSPAQGRQLGKKELSYSLDQSIKVEGQGEFSVAYPKQGAMIFGLLREQICEGEFSQKAFYKHTELQQWFLDINDLLLDQYQIHKQKNKSERSCITRFFLPELAIYSNLSGIKLTLIDNSCLSESASELACQQRPLSVSIRKNAWACYVHLAKAARNSRSISIYMAAYGVVLTLLASGVLSAMLVLGGSPTPELFALTIALSVLAGLVDLGGILITAFRVVEKLSPAFPLRRSLRSGIYPANPQNDGNNADKNTVK